MFIYLQPISSSRSKPARRSHRACWLGLLAIVLLAASQVALGEERLRVAVTLDPHAWLVEQVGGQRVDVMTLVLPGASPATYLPSDIQVSRLMGSAAYFRAGVPCENGPWLAAIAQARGLEIVDLRQGIALRDVSHSHRHGAARVAQGPPTARDDQDPHTWLSPRLLARQAKTVASVLTRLDPDSAGLYRLRLARLEEQLTELDRAIRQRLAPHAGRAFLVFHPSWGYLAEEYDLRQLSLEIEGKEPSEIEVTRLQSSARREGVTVVFVQPQITGGGAAALAAALDGRTESLDPLARNVEANLRHVAERLAASFKDD